MAQSAGCELLCCCDCVRVSQRRCRLSDWLRKAGVCSGDKVLARLRVVMQARPGGLIHY